MRKYALFLLPIMLLAGAGCTPSATVQVQPTTTNVATNTPEVSAFLPDSIKTAKVVSTVPANGDGNPYGVAFVPPGFPSGGKINSGDILVANFNNKKNLQGTGTTIVRITPSGKQSLFFQGKAPLGLTTALAVLKNGFIMVGNLPTTDGTSATAKAGSMLLIDGNGKLVTELSDANLINGPWDMAVNDNGNQVQAFITNVLSGTVVRFDLVFNSSGLVSHTGTVIAAGYAHRGDPAALEVGPTGLLYNKQTDSLLVVSTADNAVYTIPNAGSATQSAGLGTVVYKDQQHLHGPLGIIQAPNGNLIVTNSDAINSDTKQPSELVEFTPAGSFVKQLSVDPAQGGAFGIDISVSGTSAQLATVNDNTAKLLIWTIPIK